jgi:lipid-binding SYLF domain-containing protein
MGIIRLMVLTILGLSFASADAISRSKAVGRIQDAQDYLEELMDSDDTQIPADRIKRAEGIVIVRHYKIGLVLSYREGRGVAMVRGENGEWSPPAFVTSREGGIGFQIGGQSIDTIYLLMDKDGLRMLSDSRMKIGVDASAAVGHVGRDAEAKIGPEVSILAYSKAQGLYGGASFEGGAMVNDISANEAMYGIDGLRGEDILYNGKVPMPPEAEDLVELLKSYEE